MDDWFYAWMISYIVFTKGFKGRTLDLMQHQIVWYSWHRDVATRCVCVCVCWGGGGGGGGGSRIIFKLKKLVKIKSIWSK
jgi:hypothetical protein